MAAKKTVWISFCQNVSKINVLNVILSFIQSYSQVHCQHFFSSRERAVKLYTHLKSRMKEHLLKRIAKLTKECSKAKSSKEVLYFVDEIYEILASADRAPNLGLVERFNFGLLPRFNLSLVARFIYGPT